MRHRPAAVPGCHSLHLWALTWDLESKESTGLLDVGFSELSPLPFHSRNWQTIIAIWFTKHKLAPRLLSTRLKSTLLYRSKARNRDTLKINLEVFGLQGSMYILFFPPNLSLLGQVAANIQAPRTLKRCSVALQSNSNCCGERHAWFRYQVIYNLSFGSH
jgi:hypothetical protein